MQTMMLIAGVGLAGALTLGFAELCGDLVDAARASSAADAAALAGVTGGQPGAARLADVNGATVESFTAAAAPGGGTTVTVTVRVGDATSTARATDGSVGD